MVGVKLNPVEWRWLFIAWLVATVSSLGSLFFSEIMGLIPCVLCWYQRIFMFPVAILLLVGLWRGERQVVWYALPLVLIGLLFTLYHLLLFYGFIPENMRPCQQGISCSDPSMVLFDFLPIPWLSLIAFGLMLVSLIFVMKGKLSEAK